ncbi:MAG: DUF58 domain-containing protein [Cyanobacteria bacterium J06626_6]
MARAFFGVERGLWRERFGHGLQQLLKKSAEPSPLGVLLVYRVLKTSHGLKLRLTKYFTPAGMGVLCALFIFGLIGLDIKRSVSYQIFVFLLALLFVSVVLSRFVRCRMGVTRRLPRFGTVDVPLQYRVVVHNHQAKKQIGCSLSESFDEAFPTLAELRHMLSIRKGGQRAWHKLIAQRSLAFAPAIALPPLPPNSQTEVTAELVPLRRGPLRLNQLTVACPEPLGLLNRCRTIALGQQVLILPKRYRLPRVELPGTRHYQSNELAAATSVGDSEEFRSLRDYRPGDSPRKIHWKSWAKTGKPIVKEEQEEYSVRHGLILDTFHTERESEAMEEAIAIATSFIYSLQTAGHSQEALLDTLFMGDKSHCFTLGRGMGEIESVLTLLASAQPCQDKSFETLTKAVSMRISLLSGCICIFLDWDSDRQQLVEQLQTANIPTLALIVSGEKGLAEQPDLSCLKNGQSRFHILPVGNIQEALLSL